MYQSLFMFWVANNKVVLSENIENIFVEDQSGIKVTLSKTRQQFSFKFSHIYIFDDENVLDIPNALLSRERIYRINFPWENKYLKNLKEPLKIVTGRKFPKVLYISTEETRAIYRNPPYAVCAAVSFLTKDEIESFECSERSLKFFFEDFMEYFAETGSTPVLYNKITDNIMSKYSDTDYITVINDEGELKSIVRLFWEKFFTFSEKENENISNFRACFDFSQFLKISLKANKIEPTKLKDKEHAREIENQMSEIVRDRYSSAKST